MTSCLFMCVLHVGLLQLLSMSESFGQYTNTTKDQVPVTSGQDVVDYIAKYGQVKVTVVDNLNKVAGFIPIEFNLTNTGQRTIGPGDWRIYYYALYSVGSRGETLDCGLRVCPVDKGLFYFTPADKNLLPDITPGYTLRCTYHNRNKNVARTDQMPNWYVTSGDAVPKTIESTEGEDLSFVGPFNSPAQWKTSKDDKYNPYTPEERFSMYTISDSTSTAPKLVPTPLLVNQSNIQGDTVNISAGNQWVIVESPEFQFESRVLAGALNLQLVKSDPQSKYIMFVSTNAPRNDNQEEYDLEISTDKETIVIKAECAKGAMHGTQTLISLAESNGGIIPTMSIRDKPRFRYRGVMVDVARNFKPKAWVMKLLDVMSMYKLNTLHLHITDDEGWRVEIPEIPELTQIGSQRCHSEEGLCLIPFGGSGPTNTTVGSGFYSVSDYRDILKYAADRHITVIPELDLPGHSTAAIHAMRFREAKRLSANRKPLNEESYLLNDIEANETCGETFHRYNAINPCMDSTYRFVEKVIDGIQWLHSDVMPLETLHIGGDEVANGVWDLSPACQRLVKSRPINTRQLQKVFLVRVSAILATRGLSAGTWDDGVYGAGGPYPVSDIQTPVQVYPWDNLWGSGKAKRAYEFADAGYKVVLTLATHLYFSHTHEPDPEERGITWATRFVDTNKVFRMMPDDVYSNADVTYNGDPIDKKKLCQNNQCPRTSKPENIIGMQACVWSEVIRTEDQLHFALFPKLLAFAERAWHKAPWEDIDDVTSRDEAMDDDWSMFVSTLGNKELPRLERRGVQYRVAPPGARIDGSSLLVKAQFPNHVVEMSTDGGATWTAVVGKTRLSENIGAIQLRTRSPVLDRASRIIEIQRSIVSSASKIGVRTVAAILYSIISILTHLSLNI